MCGQKVSPPRLTLREIGHELLHALVHIDRSVLSLIRMLLVQPGFVALDYVSGKRKRYFGPFAFLVVVVALTAGAIEISGFQTVVPETPDNAVVRLTRTFLEHHINLLFFAQVPVLAAVCRVISYPAAFNYAEWLVLASYTSGMHMLFYVFVVIPVWYAFSLDTESTRHLFYATLPVWYLYFSFATSQFLQRRRVVSAFKGLLAIVLSQVTTMVAVSLVFGLIAEVLPSSR